MQFTLNYGHVWTSQLGDETWTKTLKRHWYEKLEKISLNDIHEALKFLESSHNSEFKKFPPTVFEFKELPQKLKASCIPREIECYHAAITGNWALHPIVKPTAEACNVYWLRHQASDHEGRKRFSGYYAMMKEKFLKSEPLSTPPTLDKPKINSSRKLSAVERFHLKLADNEKGRKTNTTHIDSRKKI